MTFLHSVVFSIQGFDQESLGLVFFFGDLFVLGTRTLRKGGVMIHWLGRLGRCVGASNHAIFVFLVRFVLAAFWSVSLLHCDAFYIYMIIFVV